MALIPLNQKIKIHKPDGEDEWGYPIEGETVELEARVDEEINKVTNPAGDEVITSLEAIVDGLPDVKYDDEVEYEDELGRVTKRKPQLIEPIRMISGDAIMTSIHL